MPYGAFFLPPDTDTVGTVLIRKETIMGEIILLQDAEVRNLAIGSNAQDKVFDNEVLYTLGAAEYVKHGSFDYEEYGCLENGQFYQWSYGHGFDSYGTKVDQYNTVLVSDSLESLGK